LAWLHPVPNVPQNRSCHEKGRSPRVNVMVRDGTINLVSNAAKYCDAERPMLTIISRATDTAIELDFVDNGAGIPADSHSVIFEKFARLDNDKAANSTGGAGLGLAISREIMERLGGEIAYLADQKGAAFRVTLPISGSVLRPVANAL
ncbi:MAG: signal transduction histidine kinase, partial [Dinoroseobacter sp.]